MDRVGRRCGRMRKYARVIPAARAHSCAESMAATRARATFSQRWQQHAACGRAKAAARADRWRAAIARALAAISSGCGRVDERLTRAKARAFLYDMCASLQGASWQLES